MKSIKLYLPDSYIRELDQLVDKGYYPNRVEAIRIAVRDLLIDEVSKRRVYKEAIETKRTSKELS